MTYFLVLAMKYIAMIHLIIELAFLYGINRYMFPALPSAEGKRKGKTPEPLLGMSIYLRFWSPILMELIFISV